ncbi:TPA: hypothetical protein DCZ32_00050 [Candidatus Uhrbacteria bacterium]|nr:hypothetical protein [Candidatus Uhrbacteria bacterium]
MLKMRTESKPTTDRSAHTVQRTGIEYKNPHLAAQHKEAVRAILEWKKNKGINISKLSDKEMEIIILEADELILEINGYTTPPPRGQNPLRDEIKAYVELALASAAVSSPPTPPGTNVRTRADLHTQTQTALASAAVSSTPTPPSQTTIKKQAGLQTQTAVGVAGGFFNPPPDIAHPQKRKLVATEIAQQDIEASARDTADRQLAQSAQELTGVRGFFRRIWNHNIAREYREQREASRVRAEIYAQESVYAGAHGARTDEDRRAREAIVSRFMNEYEESVHAGAGEEKHVYGERNEEEGRIKAELQALLREYASNPTMSEQAFRENKNRILADLYDRGGEHATSGVNYADNIFDFASELRRAVEHGTAVDALDTDFDLVIGRARMGVRTEAQFNAVERITKRITDTRVGSLVNESTVAIAVATVYGVTAKVLPSVARSRLAAWGTFGLSALAAGGIAGARESTELERERKQHAREMAKGMSFDNRTDSRRVEMERFRHQTARADQFLQNIESLWNVRDGKREFVDLNQAEFNQAISDLAQLQARICVSDSSRIDLLSYGSAETVESERTQLDIARAQARVRLRELVASGKAQIPAEFADFDAYFDQLQDMHSDGLTRGVEGISERDRSFRKFKRGRVAKAVLKGVVIGAGIGMVAQEVGAAFGEREGIIDALRGKSGFGERLTALEYLRRWAGGTLSGEATGIGAEQVGANNITFPNNIDVISQPDGTIDIIENSTNKTILEGLPVDSDGRLTAEAVAMLEAKGAVVSEQASVVQGEALESHTYTAQEWLDQHKDQITQVKRDLWYGNNTAMYVDPETGKLLGADLNELKLLWGAGGDGIDESGNFVMNAGEMAKDGSFQGMNSADAQQLLADGKLKLMISASVETQNTAFMIDLDANGNAIIPQDHPAAKFFSVGENGKAVFLGKYAEAVQLTQSEDGIQHVRMLATAVGEGTDKITGTIAPETSGFSTYIGTPSEYHLDPFMIMPVFGRRPLERGMFPDLSARGDIMYYGGDNSEFGLLPRNFYDVRLSPSIKENKDLDFSTDDSEIVKEYLKDNGPEYANELEQMIKDAPEMKKSIKVSITVPAFTQERDIEQTLRQYATMDSHETFEIVILDNHAKNVPQGNIRGVVERMRQEFPTMNIVYMHKIYNEKPPIGRVRKELVDSVLLRKQKAKKKKPIVIASNDADLVKIRRNYATELAKAFRNNPRLDAVGGKWDYPVEAYKQFPLFHAAQRLWHYFDTAFRFKYMKSPDLVGRNSAYSSGAYAAVGGYNSDAIIGEDLEIGWFIKHARGNDVSRVKYLNSAGLVSNPRRAVVKMLSEVRLVNQYGDFHMDENVRKASIEDLLKNKRDFTKDEFQKEATAIYDFYGRWRASKGGWIPDKEFHSSFARAMSMLGVKYEITDDKPVVTDTSKLEQGLGKFESK